MTDSHCHVPGKGDRHFICDPSDARPGPHDTAFFGFHPWEFLDGKRNRLPDLAAALQKRLEDNPCAGVGEIGLDRLKCREIAPVMREAFTMQLELAAYFRRPAVVHGAKCWGETVRECKKFNGRIPAFLFHGFSRSWGLLGEIESIGGYVSAGPAVLNSHAANYRKDIASVPEHMLLAESDATADNFSTSPKIEDIILELAKIRNANPCALAASLDANAAKFVSSLTRTT